MHFHRTLTLLLVATGLSASEARSAAPPTVLKVDARDASRRILHAALKIPARPGPLTLLYPKWIPGEHAPTGPIVDLAGLKMSAAGQPIAWRRDPLDNYALQMEVPPGADAVDVTLDFLLPTDPNGFSSAASSSANLVVISWNTLLLYPKGAAAGAVSYTAHLKVPDGWKFATALPLVTESADGIEFAPVTLETLIDSPLIAGAQEKRTP
jgi:predicted metalloprotease with PDZ domain